MNRIAAFLAPAIKLPVRWSYLFKLPNVPDLVELTVQVDAPDWEPDRAEWAGVIDAGVAVVAFRMRT